MTFKSYSKVNVFHKIHEMHLQFSFRLWKTLIKKLDTNRKLKIIELRFLFLNEV